MPNKGNVKVCRCTHCGGDLGATSTVGKKYKIHPSCVWEVLGKRVKVDDKVFAKYQTFLKKSLSKKRNKKAATKKVKGAGKK